MIVIIVLLVGAVPRWKYNSGWGYWPSGIVGLLLVILLVLMIFRYIPIGFTTY